MSKAQHQITVNMDRGDTAAADVERAALAALRVAGAEPPGVMTVQITTAEAVHDLNRTYADIDAPTDVLSFPSEGDPFDTEPGEPPYLGDVVIAYPIAEAQAAAAGHPVTAELQILTIHGTLHLLGYDHETPEQEAEMDRLQAAAMEAIRASNP